MKRVIAMVRSSTIKQSIEDQHNEMVEFLKLEGYSEDEIEWVEEQGASAAKVDDEYQAMIAKVKSIIETTPSIKAFAVWHLNRAFRTEDSYVDLKKFLIAHKVNLICKNPYLRLLTPTGEVDKGMELAAGLLAILAKQDQEERVEKFSRAKRGNAKKGKYNGGILKYGYCLDENNYVVPNEPEAEIIRTIYNMYATGKYSAVTLTKELMDIGITRNGKPFTTYFVSRMLCETAYAGYTDRKGSHRKFIPIVDKTLWDKVKEIREKNYTNVPRTKTLNLGTKILKCPECGGNLNRDKNHYICWRHISTSMPALSGNKCGYSLCVPANPSESIFWHIGATLHMNHLMNATKEVLPSYNQTLVTLEKKLDVQTKRLEALQRKKNKVVDSYIDEIITKPQRDEKLAKIASDINICESTIQILKSDYKKTLEIISKLEDEDAYAEALADALFGTMEERDTKKMFDIVHTYIDHATVQRVQYGTPDPRSKRPNALEYTITLVGGKVVYKYLYIASKHLYYEWQKNKWVEVYIEVL